MEMNIDITFIRINCMNKGDTDPMRVESSNTANALDEDDTIHDDSGREREGARGYPYIRRRVRRRRRRWSLDDDYGYCTRRYEQRETDREGRGGEGGCTPKLHDQQHDQLTRRRRCDTFKTGGTFTHTQNTQRYRTKRREETSCIVVYVL